MSAVKSRSEIAVTTLVVLFATGCYTAVPIGLDVPQPETRIVAGITDVGSDRLAPQIGVAAVEIEGIVTAATDSVWRIRLKRVDQRGGVSTFWNEETVSFPRSALTGVREKRLDKKRSWMMAGLGVAGAFMLQRLASLIAAEEDNRNPPIVPPA